MIVARHTENGVLRGFWLTTTRYRAYFAVRTTRQLAKPSYTWAIEKRIIDKAVEEGVQWIGVFVNRGKRHDTYATHISDFLGEHAVQLWGDTKQVGLAPARFKLSPERCYQAIERAVRIR